MQGSLPEIQRVGRCVILTLHDLGSSHLSLQDFFSLPCLAALTSTSLLLHISLPGQQPEAPDCPTTARYPSMQEMSEAVLGILDILNLTEVVILGVGAGANIAARFAMNHPGRVQGMLLVDCKHAVASFPLKMKVNITGRLSHGLTVRLPGAEEQQVE